MNDRFSRLTSRLLEICVGLFLPLAVNQGGNEWLF